MTVRSQKHLSIINSVMAMRWTLMIALSIVVKAL